MQQVSFDSSAEESESEKEDGTGEDIGILEEAWDNEDESPVLQDDLLNATKDPDWNANMEDEESDSSDDDELNERDVEDDTSHDAR